VNPTRNAAHMALAVAFVLIALPAAGQNLVFGSFDTPADVDIWLNTGPNSTWSSLDFAGSPTSGSVLIANDLGSAGAYPIWSFVAQDGPGPLAPCLSQFRVIGPQAENGPSSS